MGQIKLRLALRSQGHHGIVLPSFHLPCGNLRGKLDSMPHEIRSAMVLSHVAHNLSRFQNSGLTFFTSMSYVVSNGPILALIAR